MTTSIIIRDIDRRFRCLNFVRKPASFAEVYQSRIPPSPISMTTATDLGIFTAAQLGINNPLEDISNSIIVPMVFVLDVDGQMYIVNTEGYNWCRYITPCIIVD